MTLKKLTDLTERDIARELLNFDIFADLTGEDLRDLVEKVEVIAPTEGEYLIHEGQASRSIYFIYRGKADVFKSVGTRRIKIASLSRGDFFGEIGIILHSAATATVRARRDLVVFTVSGDVLLDFMDRYSSIFYRIFKISTDRLSNNNLFQIRQMLEEIEFFYKRFINVQSIWHFLPTDLVVHALRGNMKAIETARREWLTVLFLDIRHYTIFAEMHDPDLVLEELNKMLGRFSTIISRHRGAVDKFTGDGLMAVFRRDSGKRANAANAIRASIDIMKELREINRDRARWLAEEFYIGIGIDSGEVMFGNVGVSGQVMNSTVIGDTVNVASRLANYERNNRIIVSQESHRLAKAELKNVEFSSKEEIVLPGRLNPVVVHRIDTSGTWDGELAIKRGKTK
ncbi:cyclic nucleotide-binding domain-containing protein [bacterium]|nr:cyclic nucleotide-binding domain-containing protein [bacterium]